MTRIMMILQLLLVVALVLTMAGHKWHWWGFGVLSTAMAAELVAILLLGLTSLGLLLWIGYRKLRRLIRQGPRRTSATQGSDHGRGRGRRRRRSSLPANPTRVPQLAVIVGVTVLLIVVGLSMVGSGLDKPLIHDVTTDIEDVPQYRAALVARSIRENSLEYEGAKIARLQVSHYPDVVPLVTTVDVSTTYATVEALVAERGWEVLRSDPAAGELEAVVETELMGFRDDVIIRVRPEVMAEAPDRAEAPDMAEAPGMAEVPGMAEAPNEAAGEAAGEDSAAIAGAEAEVVAEAGAETVEDADAIKMAPPEPRAATGSRVDMRSVSRVGNGDLGANAARIEAFMADLSAALEPQLVSRQEVPGGG
ncbi:DUF1499 domain-containing protein [Pseudomaricurvus sp. HS19]|uniref:DUF1499 domain-containing protein n=1 Tax=Pseudomaricurvus sp. HS19 TaxID=2692626 RepID=UPI00136F8413|nr:DUF1499 domain-containing protein [Pseudomaricurvus sp. HS19]MYM61791.1 DUF1499 domain-containing protein [Pseudomaricurvus sp. HS19]